MRIYDSIENIVIEVGKSVITDSKVRFAAGGLVTAVFMGGWHILIATLKGGNVAATQLAVVESLKAAAVHLNSAVMQTTLIHNAVQLVAIIKAAIIAHPVAAIILSSAVVVAVIVALIRWYRKNHRL